MKTYKYRGAAPPRVNYAAVRWFLEGMIQGGDGSQLEEVARSQRTAAELLFYQVRLLKHTIKDLRRGGNHHAN